MQTYLIFHLYRKLCGETNAGEQKKRQIKRKPQTEDSKPRGFPGEKTGNTSESICSHFNP